MAIISIVPLISESDLTGLAKYIPSIPFFVKPDVDSGITVEPVADVIERIGISTKGLAKKPIGIVEGVS